LPTPLDRGSISLPHDRAAKQTNRREDALTPFKHAVLMAGLLACAAAPAFGQTLIVGNDEKQGVDENLKPTQREPGHDSLSIIDISQPAAPRITATIPLMNSVVGPPTNLAVTPAGDVALVANSIEPVIQGWGHRLEPDNKVFVVDLKANPPTVIGTVTVGKQPSGLAISPKGDLALVANRGDGTISVLAVKGKDTAVIATVPVGTAADLVSAVAITPDGKHALAVKPAANKVALLSIDGDKVTYDKRDLPTGIFPYNVAVTPDGRLALTADNGNNGGSDGNADTVGVIDLAANPPRVIDHVTVGDSPEGLAISPKGNLAVSVQAEGSNQPKTSFFHHDGGSVAVLAIDGNKVTKVGSVTVGTLPEGVAFSADGSHIYVGNFIDGDLSVLKVEGTNVTDTGQRLKLPGHPASMRAGPQ
jgi:DNA-binding beta-propeller fold protein YncE